MSVKTIINLGPLSLRLIILNNCFSKGFESSLDVTLLCQRPVKINCYEFNLLFSFLIKLSLLSIEKRMMMHVDTTGVYKELGIFRNNWDHHI